MNVKELRDLLAQYPDDMPVLWITGGGWLVDIEPGSDVSTAMVDRFVTDTGEHDFAADPRHGTPCLVIGT